MMSSEVLKEMRDELAKKESAYKKAQASRAEKFERERARIKWIEELKIENSELKSENSKLLEQIKKLKKKKGK